MILIFLQLLKPKYEFLAATAYIHAATVGACARAQQRSWQAEGHQALNELHAVLHSAGPLSVSPMALLV